MVDSQRLLKSETDICKLCGSHISKRCKNGIRAGEEEFKILINICYDCYMNDEQMIRLRRQLKASRQKSSFVKIYGTDNPMKNESIKNKLSKIISSKEIQDKTKKTCRDRYGVDYVMHDEDIKQRKIKTDKENHGGVLSIHTKEAKENLNKFKKEHKDE